MKKSILFSFLFPAMITVAMAQTDSSAKKDSFNSKDIPAAKINGPDRLNQKQTGKQAYSLYKPSPYENNYRLHWNTQANYNTTPATIIGITGNLLLSLFADKTNHAYQPNYNH